VPTGWATYEDTTGNFNLAPPGVSPSDAQNAVNIILVWETVQAAAMNCTGTADPNPPETAKGLAHWLDAPQRPDCDATAPRCDRWIERLRRLGTPCSSRRHPLRRQPHSKCPAR
jgi:hypothetical protein